MWACKSTCNMFVNPSLFGKKKTSKLTACFKQPNGLDVPIFSAMCWYFIDYRSVVGACICLPVVSGAQGGALSVRWGEAVQRLPLGVLFHLHSYCSGADMQIRCNEHSLRGGGGSRGGGVANAGILSGGKEGAGKKVRCRQPLPHSGAQELTWF